MAALLKAVTVQLMKSEEDLIDLRALHVFVCMYFH